MAGGPPDDESTRKASLADSLRLALARAAVSVVSGPDAGSRVEIGPAGCTLGTAADCDLRLFDDWVSRRHLSLSPEVQGVRVRDLGSRNGTFFAGGRLGEMVLTESGTLSLGKSVIDIKIDRGTIELELSQKTRFGDAIAESRAMRHVFGLLEKAAGTDTTVLLEGDSGTGKDVLAVAVHRESPRREAPFVVLDCAATPDALFESELFGNERGAFTGAVSSRAGALEQAHGGTLFLDEVGELPQESQRKLLRALENRSFRRLGGSRTVDVDVRVIAATNRRLREAVRCSEFRADLFYRLAVVHVSVPSLRERREDVVPLAESFLRKATGSADARLPPDLVRLLLAYDWPGNARELRNVIERFATFQRADKELLFAAGASLDGHSTPDAFAGLDQLSYHEAKQRLIDAFHRSVLPRVVERAGGSVPRAAKLLELPKASLYRMLQAQKGGAPEDEDPDA